MAQVVVRNIDDEAFARFKERAKSEGTTVEAKLRRIVENEPPRLSRDEALAQLRSLRAMSPRSEVSSVEVLRALRDGDDGRY